MRNIIKDWFKPKNKSQEPKKDVPETPITPGRVSEPDDDWGTTSVALLKGLTKMVTPSFRREVIPLIRKLYKVNPDMSIAIQDMFKLGNTGHQVTFPNNTDAEADKMRDHLTKVTKKWSRYSAGIDGLINRMIVQQYVSGAISIEAVPNDDLSGLSTVLFLKPENIFFKRENNGVYSPYQRNKNFAANPNKDYIKLNPETYFYCGTFNDTDEPYGIPPFMGALDSIKTQADMKINMKHTMEIAGMIGFLEALVEKPQQRGNESDDAYTRRLSAYLRRMKKATMDGMKDGIIVGFKDDHEFNLNSTTKDLGNLEKPWNINEQGVANGLGVNASIIGAGTAIGEGANGVVLSKMISQLKNLQIMVTYILEKLYLLELLLAGFNCKGITITWGTSTVTDDVKIQQARQYKIQNLNMLYAAGIISQEQYAYEAGYDSPSEKEPRVPLETMDTGKSATKRDGDAAKKEQSNKNQRDKKNPSPKRKDGDSKPR